MVNWVEKNWMGIKEARSKYGLRRYFLRTLIYHWNKMFRPLDREKISAALERLGLDKGDLVCVHSRFSALGYVKGGPTTFIQALEDVVGPSGTIMMPAFSMRASMLSYIESGEIFDVRNTPSQVGLLTEAFRKYPGVKRSLHPTNSVTAKGPLADALLEGHEKSLTPYGVHTPYGRLLTFNGKVLMIHTGVLSFLHHVQEEANWPYMYFDGSRELKYRDGNGVERCMETQVMRTKPPYLVALPGKEGREYDFIPGPDYALIFPEEREKLLIQAGYRFQFHPTVRDRRKHLINEGILRVGNLGAARIGLIETKGYSELIIPELKDLLERFHEAYDPEKMDQRNLPYF